jgi:hypothetical protein
MPSITTYPYSNAHGPQTVWNELHPPHLSNPQLPTNYRLSIQLTYDTSSASPSTVTGANFVVTDTNSGHIVYEFPRLLTSLPDLLTPTPHTNITPDELHPIVAFQMVLVGPSNGNPTILTQGSGTFTISADQLLVPNLRLPNNQGTSWPGGATAETANSTYGMLPFPTPNPVRQTFTYS